MNLSKNGIAAVVFAIELVLTAIGVEFEQGSVLRVVEAIVVVGAFFLMVWHQFERPDTKWGIFKA